MKYSAVGIAGIMMDGPEPQRPSLALAKIGKRSFEAKVILPVESVDGEPWEIAFGNAYFVSMAGVPEENPLGENISGEALAAITPGESGIRTATISLAGRRPGDAVAELFPDMELGVYYWVFVTVTDAAA